MAANPSHARHLSNQAVQIFIALSRIKTTCFELDIRKNAFNFEVEQTDMLMFQDKDYREERKKV